MRRKTQGILVTAVGIGCLWASAALALNWPATSATLVGSANSLGAGYEPSGIVALADGRVAMVGDDGDVTLMSQEGQIIGNWSPGGDLEGITEIGDGYVYVAVEHPDTIKQFNLSTGQFTGKSWDLTGWLKGSDNLGMEALTFVPNGHHPYVSGLAGGLFYAGLQADGKIYVINVDLTTTNAAELVDVIDLGKTSDISGLDFDVDTGLMYALYDGYNELLEATPAGEILKTYSVVGNDQEGIALVPNCETGTASVFIAEDVGPEVWRYSPYPITCQVEVPPVVEEPPIEEVPPVVETPPVVEDPAPVEPPVADPVPSETPPADEVPPTTEVPDEPVPTEEPAPTAPVEDGSGDGVSETETPVVDPPVVPEDFRKHHIKPRKVKVRWSDVADRYELDLYTKGRGKLVTRFTGLNEAKKVIGKKYLKSDRKYWIRARACNEAGCSEYTPYIKIKNGK